MDVEASLVRQDLNEPRARISAHRLQRRALGAAALSWLAACAGPRPAPRQPQALPQPLREFRAAWVATVAHIDWPSRRDLGTEAQRAEMLALLERARLVGLNAIVLQVRPSADAIYPSPLEPWSEYLTGASGRAPDPPWDPLAEWVHEAHRRGLELHAWFNPYRARHPSARSEPAPTHVARAAPAIVRPYGEWLWLDPGEALAAERFRAVVLDVVQRYDVDGVHIDDYFYPYPVPDGQGGEQPFPDDAAWSRYRALGGTLPREDWRRDNVERLVESLYREVHRAKPWVRVGISPFGLPRPDRRPAGIAGFSQYDKLYADVEHWLQQGWLDYLAPQLYWPIAQVPQAFEVLLDNWLQASLRGRPVWPGLFTSRVGAARDPYAPEEVLAQIDAVRVRHGTGGHLHFSMAALLQDREGIATRLHAEAYAEPALTPELPWLDEPAPAPVRVEAAATAGAAAPLAVQPGAGAPWRTLVLWQRSGGRWQLSHRPFTGSDSLAPDPQADRAALAGVGRSGRLGPELQLQRGSDGLWRPRSDA